MKIIEGLVQGSAEWRAVRTKYPCASESPVVMGKSRHMTRAEFLRLKAAGMEKEFTDYVQRMVLDKGHQVEAPARDITEGELGEPLFPATAVSNDDWGLASLDGITMTEEVIFEHKQWSEELAAAIRCGATEYPDGQEWQMEHQLIVAEGAEKVLFVCSDGTAERRVQMEYRRVPGRAEQLRAGWAQFNADLAAGVAPPAPPKAVAAPLEMLPAVNVRMEGALKVISNLDALEPLLRAFIDRIPAKPTSDDDFAFTDAACKALKKIEEELDRSEAAALGSLEPVEQMQRLKAMLHKLARDTRLQREKLVEARKLEIRTEEIARGKAALAEFIAAQNAAIGKPYMPLIAADFATAIKGKKTVQSVRDSIDQHLADCKLAATEASTRIQTNMRALRELAHEHAFLFADTQQLVQRNPDDCRLIIQARITEHKAAEERRAAELAEQARAKIRQEEEAKAREQARRDQEAEDALIASIRANALRIEADTVPYIQKAIGMFESGAKDFENDPRPRVVSAIAEARAQMAAKLEAAQTREEAARQAAEAAKPAPTPAPVVSGAPAVVSQAPQVVPMPTRAPVAASSQPTLRLGEIQKRIAPLSIDAAGLALLGIPHAKQEGAAKLWREESFVAIVDALIGQLARAKLRQLEAA